MRGELGTRVVQATRDRTGIRQDVPGQFKGKKRVKTR